MNDNVWEEEDNFMDMPEAAQTGTNGKPAQSVLTPPVFPKQSPAQPPTRAQAPAPIVEEVEEELEEEYEEEVQEEDYSEVLSDAHLRLEQGGLYKLIMNHSLFEDTDADPRAVQNVQREIRQFAKERMEIMLGMRQATPINGSLEFVSSFNALEVEVLKSLAYAATKGATETEEANELALSVAQTPRRNTLKPIGTTAKKVQQNSKVASNTAKKSLPKQAAAPVKRSKLELTIEQIAREEGVPLEALELDISGIGGKSIAQMTPAELLERDRLVAKRRQTSVKSPSALPMATYEQATMLAAAQSDSGMKGFAQKIEANVSRKK